MRIRGRRKAANDGGGYVRIFVFFSSYIGGVYVLGEMNNIGKD